MTYSQKARELRRCKATKANGEPCKAWAMWSDPEGRCMAHAGVKRDFTGRYKKPIKTQAVACTCATYSWPHRPGSGWCQWPDPPLVRVLIPESTHRWPRMCGVMKLLERHYRREKQKRDGEHT